MLEQLTLVDVIYRICEKIKRNMYILEIRMHPQKSLTIPSNCIYGGKERDRYKTD